MHLVLSSGANTKPVVRDTAVVVATPLDAIMQLEQPRGIATVVLAGSYAQDPAIVEFLHEFYPSIRIERES
jgi:hypothetical protein